MAYKIPRLPKYAGRIFRGKSIPDNRLPDDSDAGIALAALHGKRIAQIIAGRAELGRNELGTADIMAACKRVRDAVRRGEAPGRIKAEFPEFVGWQMQDFRYVPPKPKPETGHPPRLPRPPMTDEEAKLEAQKRVVVRAGAARNVQDQLRKLKVVALEATNEEPTPDTASDYARRLHAKTLPFVSGIAVVKLAEEMIRGDPELIKRGLDAAGFPGGRARSVNVGLFFGGGKPQPIRGGRSFERLLRSVREPGAGDAKSPEGGPSADQAPEDDGDVL